MSESSLGYLMSNGKFCTYCGAKNVENNQFCENCGQSFDDVKTSSPPQQTTSQFTPYGQSSSDDSRTSMSGSYDVLPGKHQHQTPQRQGLPTAVKVLMILFFFGLPFIFFLIFFVFSGWFPMF
ncbi:MAG: zinc-ribbon domain-containing protein [Candidatus Heimdallarchaeaceae archaeon]